MGSSWQNLEYSSDRLNKVERHTEGQSVQRGSRREFRAYGDAFLISCQIPRVDSHMLPVWYVVSLASYFYLTESKIPGLCYPPDAGKGYDRLYPRSLCMCVSILALHMGTQIAPLWLSVAVRAANMRLKYKLFIPLIYNIIWKGNSFWTIHLKCTIHDKFTWRCSTYPFF